MTLSLDQGGSPWLLIERISPSERPLVVRTRADRELQFLVKATGLWELIYCFSSVELTDTQMPILDASLRLFDWEDSLLDHLKSQIEGVFLVAVTTGDGRRCFTFTGAHADQLLTVGEKIDSEIAHSITLSRVPDAAARWAQLVPTDMERSHEQDRMVLSNLEERGDSGTRRRPVFIWIYGSRDELDRIAPRLTEKDWTGVEPEEVEGRWVIRAERDQQATEEAIFAMTDEIYATLEGTKADFDGWETSVEADD